MSVAKFTILSLLFHLPLSAYSAETPHLIKGLIDFSSADADKIIEMSKENHTSRHNHCRKLFTLSMVLGCLGSLFLMSSEAEAQHCSPEELRELLVQDFEGSLLEKIYGWNKRDIKVFEAIRNQIDKGIVDAFDETIGSEISDFLLLVPVEGNEIKGPRRKVRAVLTLMKKNKEGKSIIEHRIPDELINWADREMGAITNEPKRVMGVLSLFNKMSNKLDRDFLLKEISNPYQAGSYNINQVYRISPYLSVADVTLSRLAAEEAARKEKQWIKGLIPPGSR